MTALQNSWYNGWVAGLVADPSTTQLIQPCPPLDTTDAALWMVEDAIPPASLTFNTQIVSTLRFFDEYASAIDVLQWPQSQLEDDIGPVIYASWAAYLQGLQPQPTPDDLPTVFFQWAVQEAPEVANIGSSDLQQMAQLTDAQDSLRPYTGPDAQPVDFIGSFANLVQFVQQSPGVSFSFDSRQTSSDTSQTWTAGENTNFYGIWSGSDSTSPVSGQFAQSHVVLTSQADAYAIWSATPGAWYNSSVLNMMNTNEGSPPWPVSGHPVWNDLFGPEGGMPRLVAALVVMDGISVVVTSDAAYSSSDQEAIASNAGSGMWPFFISDGPAVTNSANFDNSGAMRIETITQANHPIVVGANVLDIGRYLGHSPTVE
jgi:hypothetical protein